MPHKDNPYLGRWRQRAAVEPGPMLLKEGEIEPFLEATLGGLGERPPEIRLREAARVARFLRCLALDGVPKQTTGQGNAERPDGAGVSEQDQAWLYELGERIWNITLQNAPIAPARPGEAMRFLKRYRSTFLRHHRVAKALAAIQALQLPEEWEDSFPPPNLISQTITSTGKGNPRLSNDLSERIYGVYFSLKRQGKRGVARQIAEVLARLRVRRERSKEGVWTYEVVQDRIKQYKRRKQRELAGEPAEGSEEAVAQVPDVTEALERWSNYLADIYIRVFWDVKQMEEDGQDGAYRWP